MPAQSGSIGKSALRPFFETSARMCHRGCVPVGEQSCFLWAHISEGSLPGQSLVEEQGRRLRTKQKAAADALGIDSGSRLRAGDGARTHDSHVGNVALYH